jgi:hypothetical protein
MTSVSGFIKCTYADDGTTNTSSVIPAVTVQIHARFYTAPLLTATESESFLNLRHKHGLLHQGNIRHVY